MTRGKNDDFVSVPRELFNQALMELRGEMSPTADALAQCLTAANPDEQKVVWLVERIQLVQKNEQATYWTGYCDKHLPDVETNNPWDACWFQRKQDAMRIALLTFGKPLARSGWQVTEHSFRFKAHAASSSDELDTAEGSAFSCRDTW